MAFPFNFNPHSDKTKLKYDSVIRNAEKTLCKLKKFLNPFCFVCKVQTFWNFKQSPIWFDIY